MADNISYFKTHTLMSLRTKGSTSTVFVFSNSAPTEVRHPFDIAKLRGNPELVECDQHGNMIGGKPKQPKGPLSRTFLNTNRNSAMPGEVVESQTPTKKQLVHLLPGQHNPAANNRTSAQSFRKFTPGGKLPEPKRDAQLPRGEEDRLAVRNTPTPTADPREILRLVENPTPNLEGEYVCPFCQRTAKSDRGFKQHMSVHPTEILAMKELAKSPLQVKAEQSQGIIKPAQEAAIAAATESFIETKSEQQASPPIATPQSGNFDLESDDGDSEPVDSIPEPQ